MIKKLDKIKGKLHSGTVLDSKNGFDVIECRRCKFRHIIPIPSAKELSETYREEYYSKEKPLYFKRAEEDREWWNLVYSDKFDTFEEYLSKTRRRVLDIGSGPGYFLLYGKKRGWQAVGVEPSRQAEEYSRGLGLEIIGEFLDEKLARQLGKFDAVHMSEVIEHLPNPETMIKIARNLLSPGGIMCVDAPNDYNAFQHTLRIVDGYKPWWVAVPHHINYFNFESAGKLLERNGFKVILKEATFPIDMFLLMGDNYVGYDDLGRECHDKRKRFELSLAKAGHNDLKREIYQALAGAGIGRNLVVYGKKVA